MIMIDSCGTVHWTNEKIKSLVFHWQRTQAMFDVTCFSAFVGASNIILSVLSIHKFTIIPVRWWQLCSRTPSPGDSWPRRRRRQSAGSATPRTAVSPPGRGRHGDTRAAYRTPGTAAHSWRMSGLDGRKNDCETEILGVVQALCRYRLMV